MQSTLQRHEILFLAGLRRWLGREWRVMRFDALALVASASPSFWGRAGRRAAAQSLCRAAWQVLPGYLSLIVLVTVVLTRIVEVTAASYGLSHLALEAVVRVFVIELLPLAAALFVATRSGLDAVALLAPYRGSSAMSAPMGQIVPLVTGNGGAVLVLFVASGTLALATAYLTVHGLSHWGLPAFTRMIGQVFDPVTAHVLGFKVGLFALAVGASPVTVIVDGPRRDGTVGEMRVMARLLLLLIAIEAASLALRQVG